VLVCVSNVFVSVSKVLVCVSNVFVCVSTTRRPFLHASNDVIKISEKLKHTHKHTISHTHTHTHTTGLQTNPDALCVYKKKTCIIHR
jgi:ABC-type nickel/cobalt efflux system permease component RcnA